MSLQLMIESDEGLIPYDRQTLTLYPMETKVLKFALAGDLTEGYLLNASVQVDSLVSSLKATLSFKLENTSDWKTSDNTLLDPESTECVFYVEVTNILQTELKASLILNFELYKHGSID